MIHLKIFKYLNDSFLRIISLEFEAYITFENFFSKKINS